MKVKRADELLIELGVTEPHEIDVEAIATYCRAHVVYRAHDGCEARLLGNGQRAIISVNAAARIERRRFSVGHELGHWLHDSGRVSFLCEKESMNVGRSASTPERRANEFAAELLMPAYLFKPRVLKREMTLDTVDELAREFRTSLRATALRLVKLGTSPAALVVSDRGERDWYALGPDVPEEFRPHRELQEGSGALRLLRDEHGIIGARTEPLAVSADAWIDANGAGDHELIEQSMRVSSSIILTMLWWQDESHITEFLEET